MKTATKRRLIGIVFLILGIVTIIIALLSTNTMFRTIMAAIFLLFLLLGISFLRRSKNRIHPSIITYDKLTLNVNDLREQARSGTPISLRLGGKDIEFRLQHTPVLMDNAEEIIIEGKDKMSRAPLVGEYTFAGKTKNDPNSEVRFSIFEDLLSGYIVDQDNWWFIEPLGAFQQKADKSDYIAYRTKDLDIRVNEHFCGVDEDTKPLTNIQAEQKNLRTTDGPSLAGGGSGAQIPIIMVADQRYYDDAQVIGSTFDRQQISLLNAVNGIFFRRIGCEFRLRFVVADSRNEWLNSSDSRTLLGQLDALFQDIRFGNFNNLDTRRRFDVEVIHCTTGKNLEGNLLGRAAGIPSVFSVSTQTLFTISGGGGFGGSGTSFLNMIVAVHELGHNFGGVHSEAEERCAKRFIICWDKRRSIMWPTLYTDQYTYFTDGERNENRNNVANIQENINSGRNVNF